MGALSTTNLNKSDDCDDAITSLKRGNLNMNYIRDKIEFRRPLVADNINVLIIAETKIDNTFTTSQFMIKGFMKPFRYDRDRYGVAY